MQKNSDLIHYSRAGDIFHYRWAVKRCLKLLDFNTDLIQITIEGSKESKLAGECVVDLAEYRESESGERSVEYFQLKHSTVRVREPFTLSKLKEAIEGFAKRFIALEQSQSKFTYIKLTILTNRLISDDFKKNIRSLALGGLVPKSFISTIEKYTNLKGEGLRKFCQCLNLDDSEGNYDEQKFSIHKELYKLTVSKNIYDREKLLVAKIWERIEPGNSNVIKREDVLEAFDTVNIDDFFPAPPLFEPIENYIPREQQTSIVQSIRAAKSHTVITAGGGVGKSILSNNITTEFNESSVVVAYDCYGNGSYRRMSAKRHESKHAYTQIINTLAKEGLCDQVIPSRNEPDEYWTKIFLGRIREACNALKSQDENALLVIIFDAADNAEMAAEEQGTTCFVNSLIREIVPENCRLVFTCRPERLTLLDPPSTINRLQLSTFSDEETLAKLQTKFQRSTQEQAIEFNRLTGGNPRVQSNALSLKTSSLSKLLLSFGAKIVTVEDLIERQLEQSIERIKDEFPKNYRNSIDNICTGLAVLPPFVPISVLASAADVSKDSVTSFIADLGHPLWQIDDTVQFRDEPTEKWFQDNYSATPEKIYLFIKAIKPLATEFPYVSEVLPLLLLKANQLDELVALALSNEYLPSISKYDDNQVKVRRLQYAFKAALKAGKTYEAVKLALLAGEEIAGNDRQLSILANNIDLATIFLASGRIQELAHRKELGGNWDGSETVYAASLLSSIPSMKGEAYNYLRSANHWLQRYFKKRKEAKDEEERFDEKLEDIEILELAFTLYRINDYKKCVDFLLSWSPSTCIYRITSDLFERLIDVGEFENIELMASYGKNNPSFIIAITSELMKVGRTLSRSCLTRCLNQIIKPKTRTDKPGDDIHNSGFSNDAYLSFFEACVIHQLPIYNIQRGVNYYYNPPMLYRIADAHQYGNAREGFLRYLSLQAVLKNKYAINFEDFIPKIWRVKNNTYEENRELERAKEFIGKLFPWYIVRAKVLSGLDIDLKEEHENARLLSSKLGRSSYREYEPIPFEITRAKFQNILYCASNYLTEKNIFVEGYVGSDLNVSFIDDFYFLRVSCRNEKFASLSESIEECCRARLNNYDYDESPETRSENFIKLSRAIITVGRDDAAAYFDEALSKATEFGEEGVIRWEALTSIAKRSSQIKIGNPELSHRYMRCAEMIGDAVAREKYWDRNDAVSTCFQLSAESTFPILHRWKDRNVGWHDRQMHPLAHSAIDSGLASSGILWSLSTFSWEYGLDEFLEKCISNEPAKENQQQMLCHYIRDLRICGYTGDKWLKLKMLANKYSLSYLPEKELKHLSVTTKQDNSSYSLKRSGKEEEKDYPWHTLYGQFDLLTDNGFINAYQCFESQGYPRKLDEFWQGCFLKVTSRRLGGFLNVIARSEKLGFFELRSAFDKIPQDWKNKVSVQKQWNFIIKHIASRFPSKFTEIYERNYILAGFLMNEATNDAIADGVNIGLSNSVDIESPRALFSFAHYSANKLTMEQAQEMIDFGLVRLETFLDADYADGSWNYCNRLPKNLPHAVVCYIYANLGSPHAEERWRAVHAVTRLYDLNCQNEINLLLDCYIKGLPQSYIPTKYKFYDLHAKLYLLVALTRCVYKSPMLLIGNKDCLSKIAINNEQGILFQYYSKQICLALKNYSSDVFDDSLSDEIKRVCTTKYPVINGNKYKYRVDTPWHNADKLGVLPDIWFAHDFDRYWFEPLGQVFGVSGKQVEDLAKYVLINRWKESFDSSHILDSRTELWKRNHRDTYHSHSSYPKIDSYSFYISYHLMLEVASMLLDSMPVINDENYDIDCWENWLSRHLILNRNNILLAELRDPMPLKAPKWVSDKDDKDWKWQIIEADFLDHLVQQDDSITWLNVNGGFDNYKNPKNEHVSFISALVPKHLSKSLLCTIVKFENHLHECYLSCFCEDEYDDEEKNEFRCEKWLITEGENNDVESNDPFVGVISARPYRLKQFIVEQTKVAHCDNYKSYRFSSNDSPCFKNIFWSEDRPNDTNTYISSGHLALASLDFLKLVCNTLNVDIAIQVNIQRVFKNSYKGEKNEDELGYIPRYSKTFILSGDGKLRDTRKSYQLR
ncbi:Uncharacterised protein [Serratia quinivorans]|uniref:hypothetical protein n=1 Tax=Serratia quinivorans TaxID=137545 RepID=UPI00217B1063|nr:hypothetical protein [Serratia quinivorans]CAI1627943.1 Uncharacterised protein [Serratia quinivorans]